MGPVQQEVQINSKISFRKSKNRQASLPRVPPSTPLLHSLTQPPTHHQSRRPIHCEGLDELKGLDYAYEHYGADEYGHTMYLLVA